MEKKKKVYEKRRLLATGAPAKTRDDAESKSDRRACRTRGSLEED